MVGEQVRIEWLDSNVIHGWRPDSELELDDVAHCRVWGIIKAEDKKKITIAFGDSDCNSVMETITIPKSCITSIRELK